MATKTVVTFVDDLTGEGSDDVTNLEFALDGVTYEIDLNEKNANELRDTLAVYIDNGRRVGGHSTRRLGQRPAAKKTQQKRKGATVTVLPAAGPTEKRSRETNQQIRAWARSKGLEVAERGAIPKEVVQRWNTEQARKSKPA